MKTGCKKHGWMKKGCEKHRWKKNGREKHRWMDRCERRMNEEWMRKAWMDEE
jgi:hypothetical protein